MEFDHYQPEDRRRKTKPSCWYEHTLKLFLVRRCEPLLEKVHWSERRRRKKRYRRTLCQE